MNATNHPAIGRNRVAPRWLLTAGLVALGVIASARHGEAEARRAGDGGDRARAKSPAPASASGCERRRDRNRQRGRLIGGALGGIGGLVAGGRNRAALAGALIPAGALLGDAIAGLLDCDEQAKASAATERALSGGVGTTTTWTSTTRAGVSGSSTVTAAARTADGGDCMTVTDVVIVDGEETTVDKRMCRKPGGGNYVVAV
jgi:surface antigen